MKTVQFLSILISFFSFFSLQAQLYEIPIDEKIAKSSLVIEGEIVDSHSYFDEIGEIYTIHKTSIREVLKGKTLPERYISIITKGGNVNELSQTWTHLLETKKGEKGILFLHPSKYPFIEKDGFPSNRFSVYSSSQGFLKYSRNNGKEIATEPFNIYSNVFSLKEAIRKSVSQNTPFELEMEEKESCLVYSIQPSDDTNPSELILDVKISLLSGSEKLYKSTLAVKYDTTYIGSNIFGNGILSVSGDGISALSAYNLSYFDLADNAFKIVVSHSGNISELVEVTPDEAQLAKVHIPIQFLSEIPDFDFDYEIMEIENEYFDENTQRGKLFRCIEIESNGLFVDPEILDFTPKIVAAGVRDFSFNDPPIPGKITIYGDDFGTLGEDFDIDELGNDYRVEFKHAAIGPTGNWVSPGVVNDYVFWTDDSIQVYVPSVGEFEDNNNIEQDNYCGTGTIRVVSGTNFLGIPQTDVSSEELVVRYAVKNGISGGANIIPPLESVRGKMQGIFNGAIPFFYNSSFPNNARPDVEWAMSEWRCKTGVNFDLLDEGDIPDSLLNFSCEIVWDDLPAGVGTSTGAFVQFNGVVLSCFSQSDTVVTHSWHIFKKLLVNEDLNWHIGDTIIELANNQHDLRSALLHEFGHAHHIVHSLNEEDLMYFNPESTSDYYREITPDACAAGIHEVNFSVIDVPTINCEGSPVMELVDENDCEISFTNNVQSISNIDFIRVFPSPTEGILFLKFDIDITKPKRVTIFNSTGQEAYRQKININSSEISINVKNLSEGIYFLLIETENNQFYSTKFIKS